MLQISVTNAEVSRMDKQDEPNSGFKFGSWGATLANRSNTVEDDGIRTSRMGESADDTLPGNARTVRYENDGRDSPDSAETVVIRGDRREEDYERSVNESRTNSPSSGPSGSDTSVRKLERFFDELDVAGMVPNYHSTPVSNIPGRYVSFGGQQKSSGELGVGSDSDTSSEKEQSNSANRPTFILPSGDATGQDRKEQDRGPYSFGNYPSPYYGQTKMFGSHAGKTSIHRTNDLDRGHTGNVGFGDHIQEDDEGRGSSKRGFGDRVLCPESTGREPGRDNNPFVKHRSPSDEREGDYANIPGPFVYDVRPRTPYERERKEFMAPQAGPRINHERQNR